MEATVCRNSTLQVNRTKNATAKRRFTSSKRAAMSALHAKNDTTNLSGYKLGELIENNKALLFFSGKSRYYENYRNFTGSRLTNVLFFNSLLFTFKVLHHSLHIGPINYLFSDKPSLDLLDIIIYRLYLMLMFISPGNS